MNREPNPEPRPVTVTPQGVYFQVNPETIPETVTFTVTPHPQG